MDKVTSRNFCKIYKDIQKNSVKNKKNIGAKGRIQIHTSFIQTDQILL